MEVLNIVLVLIPTLLLGIYYYVTRTFNYWKNRGVVGPEPVPLFGNVKNSALRNQFIGEVYKDIYDTYQNERVVGIFRMTTPALLLRDPEIIKHVLIKDFDLFVDRGIEFSKEGLGVNLFHSDGDTWKVLRNRFTPLFTTGKLKNMLYLMTERGDYFMDFIANAIEKQPEQQIHALMQKYTISTIAACAFGLNVDSINEKMETLKKLDETIFTLNFATELDYMYPGILKKLNSSLFPKSVRTFFDNLVKDIVTQRIGAPANRNDFMDLILEMRKQGNIEGIKRKAEDKQLSLEITDDIIAAQAFVFYIAGYETSATTMTYMLYELAKNPDIQEKLIAQIDGVLEKYDGKFTYECINELDYLEKVMNEALRMHPVVDPLQRNAQADYKVPGTNVTVKKGQTILIPVAGIHGDKKYFPDPDRFDPERFTAENSKDRPSCAFIPFGTGPRNCIGLRFAKFQIFVCITKFFSKFRVEFSSNTESDTTSNPTRPILGPLDGMPLKIVKRS